MRKGLFALCLAGVAAMMGLSGCGGPDRDGAHPLFVKAMNARDRGDSEEAIDSLEKYLRVNPASVKAHYYLGQLCHDRERYLDAAYHYRAFLSAEPQSLESENVRKWLAAAEKSLAEKLSADAPPDTAAIEVSALSEEVGRLRRETDRLRGEKQKLLKIAKTYQALAARGESRDTARTEAKPPEAKPSAPPPVPASPAPPASLPARALAASDTARAEAALPARDPEPLMNSPAPMVAPPSSYIVKSGDNFHKISKTVYGSGQYHQLIYEANRSRVSSPTKLRVGQELTIPPLPAPVP